MNAVPPWMTPGGSEVGFGPAPGDPKWVTLHDAANVVATMAGLEPGFETAVDAFPARMRDAAAWRRELAERGIEDMTAAMEPGLSALLSIEAQGGDASAAALTLWREFSAARAAILALSPPAEA